MDLNQTKRPLILNFDHSAGQFNDAFCVDLTLWQEKIRFGCKHQQFAELQQYINQQNLPQNLGCILLGSGDYHHLSQLLLERLSNTQEPIHLIVCDNHPDNMRYPFGIHCGSWIYWASQLPHVARIDVIGIHSSDIGWAHAWENHWSPLYKHKLHYWSLQQNASWTRFIGAKNAWHDFQHPDELITAFLSQVQTSEQPIYLSIDKDVLSSEVVKTNWDQGQFLEVHLHQLIQACKGRLVAADITGDVSIFKYKSRFKRVLAAADGQQEPSQAEIMQWQKDQAELNLRLMDAINQSWQI